MPTYEKITSFQNARIKLAKSLQDKKHRERENLFVVDYGRDLQRALNFGYQVHTCLYCPALADEDEKSLLQDIAPHNVFEVTPDLLEKAGYRQNPSGLLTILHTHPPLKADDLATLAPQPILALVGLQKPGNIGALLRTADATGFRAIFLVDISLDLYNPNIIRASTGACFLRNIYQLTSRESLQFFKNAKYSIISGHLNGTKSLYDVTFDNLSVIVLGTEDQGLDTIWETACDELVKIPMVGQLSDSLNVSVSGAIFMYEALRQRQFSSLS
jgi:RNA methyltransferase, TrmH family